MVNIDDDETRDLFWEQFSEQPASTRMGFDDWIELLVNSGQITVEEAQQRCAEFGTLHETPLGLAANAGTGFEASEEANEALEGTEAQRSRLKEVLELLRSISLEGTPYSDYEEDRENAIDVLVDLLYPE